MELHVSIPWLHWYVIPTLLSVVFVAYMFWPEKKNDYDGPAAGIGIALVAQAGATAGKTMFFLVIVLLSWLIALLGHYAI